MNLADFNLQNTQLLALIEEPEQEKLTLTVLLLSDGKPAPHLLVFEGVHGYQISEKRVTGPLTLLSLKITEESPTRTHLHLETNRGHRELYYTTAQIQTANLAT
ncbi:MAG TPA: hypothetical protein VGH19_14555 [Verrucomicrobiae bacterium]